MHRVLRELHLERGAHVGPLPGGGEGVRRHTVAEEEHRALVESCALIDRSWIDLVEVSGEDRQRFLNGLVTRDAKILETGHGAYGFITGPKGQVLSDVVIRALGSAMRLETAPGRGAAIADHMARYMVVDRVEIDLVDHIVPLTLAGPEAPSLLERLADGPIGGVPAPGFLHDEQPWRHVAWSLGGRKLGLSADGRLGVPSYTCWVSADEAVALWEELLGAGSAAGLVPAGYDALDRVRIEAGVPWYGRDFGEENLPQESGLEGAVDYEKGCYLGQEVVARLHFRGQASRMLRRVTLTTDEPVAPGAELLHEGREAGRLTGCGHPSAAGAAAGLAMLQRRAMGPGTRLETADGIRVEVLGEPAQV